MDGFDALSKWAYGADDEVCNVIGALEFDRERM
jgi:hypothetical protein